MKSHTENDIIKWVSGLLFGAFIIGIIIWTTTLTLMVMERVLPSSPMKWMAVALFDGGAVAWAGAFVYNARGTAQRGISLLMLILDLGGVLAMTVGAVYMGGQSLAEVPSWMGSWIINTVIYATIANVVAGYYFHVSRPEVREAMLAQRLEDKLNEESMLIAQAQVEREAPALGQILARRATARMKSRLRLPMTVEERSEWDADGEVVGESFLPAPSASPGGTPFRRLLMRLFGVNPYQLSGPSGPAPAEDQTGDQEASQ